MINTDVPLNRPDRADQVGSLLRPAKLKHARQEHAAGRCGDAELREVEDQCIKDAVDKQRAMGLKSVTDGELRRSWWHFDFLAELDGVELTSGEKQIEFHGVLTKSENIAVTGRVGFESHPMLEDFAFLRRVADAAGVTPKYTIPGPPVLHFRGGRRSISTGVYPDLDRFFEDTTETYKKILNAFYDAGCAISSSTTRSGRTCAPRRSEPCRAGGATIRTSCPRSTRT